MQTIATFANPIARQPGGCDRGIAVTEVEFISTSIRIATRTGAEQQPMEDALALLARHARKVWKGLPNDEQAALLRIGTHLVECHRMASRNALEHAAR